MMKYYQKFTHQGHLDEDSTKVASPGQHLSPVEPLLFLSTSAGGAVSPARLLNEAGCSLPVEDKHLLRVSGSIRLCSGLLSCELVNGESSSGDEAI